MKRRDFLGATLAATAGLTGLTGLARPGLAQAPNARQRPNIVLVTADDLGIQLGCYGDAAARTPNLDAFAAGGARFDRAYVTQPSCSPSRSSILTGLYPHQNGQIGLMPQGYSMREGIANLPALMHDAGYKTGIIGKLHVAPTSAFPFDFEREDYPKAFDPQWVGAQAQEFLTQTNGAPFFLYANFSDPHEPFKAQANGLPSQPYQPGQVPPFPLQRVSSPALQEELAGYYNGVARVDIGMGLLMENLRAAGQLDNTVIVFLGDHGPPFQRGKLTLYEGGVIIPLLMQWPDVTAPGSFSNALVSTVDLMPTLLEAAGVAAPPDLPGASLRALLEGRAPRWRTTLATEYTSHLPDNFYPRRAIRNERFKLILNLQFEWPNPTGSKKEPSFVASRDAPPLVRAAFDRFIAPPAVEFYDLWADPWEFRDLAGQAPYRDAQTRLLGELHDWQNATDDPLATPQGLQRVSADAPTLLGHAIQIAAPGTTLVLRGGEYRGAKAVTVPKTLTIRAYPGEIPMFLGADIVDGWNKDGALWSANWDKKFTFQPGKNGDARTIDKRFPRAADLDLAFVNGKPLVQTASRNEVKAGAFTIDEAAKKIYIGDDPTGKRVEVSAREAGFQIAGTGKAAPDIMLKGLVFAYYFSTGLQMFANGARVEHCLAAWKGENGMALRGKGVTLTDSMLVANGRKGAGISQSENVRVENNLIAWNNVERFRTAWDAAGVKMTRTRDALWARNRFQNNFSMGLWMDISVMGARVVNNVVTDNAGIGIFQELGHDSIIAFNVSTGNSVGVQVADSSATRVWNNTLVGNGRAILVKDSMRVNQVGSKDHEGLGNIGTNAADAEASATWESSDNVFVNNLLVGPQTGEKPKVGALFDAGAVHPDKSSGEMISRSASNLYVLMSAEQAVRWKPQPNGTQLEFATLDAFRADFGTLEQGSVLAQKAPFAGANDYRLKAAVAGLSPVALPAEIAVAAREAGLDVQDGAQFVGALMPERD